MEFSMDDVAKEIRGHGIDAFVTMSGGGIATIAIGKELGDFRYELLAGPGEWNSFSDSMGNTDEFYCGLDDDGETFPELDFAKLTDEQRTHPVGTIADFVVARLQKEAS